MAFSRPNAPPSNVQRHSTSFTSIFVQLSNVPAADQHGVIPSYAVTYEALPADSPQTRVVSAPTTNVMMMMINFINVSRPHSLGKSHTNLGTQLIDIKNM